MLSKKIIILIYFIFFLNNFVNAQNNKDVFAIVYINEAKHAYLYKEADQSSDILDKIPAGYYGIKTTWNTAGNIDNSWIEIIYNEKKGWLNRKYITRGYGNFKQKEEKEIEKILINLTSSLQQKELSIFKNLFYSCKISQHVATKSDFMLPPNLV